MLAEGQQNWYITFALLSPLYTSLADPLTAPGDGEDHEPGLVPGHGLLQLSDH